MSCHIEKDYVHDGSCLLPLLDLVLCTLVVRKEGIRSCRKPRTVLEARR